MRDPGQRGLYPDAPPWRRLTRVASARAAVSKRFHGMSSVCPLTGDFMAFHERDGR